MCERGGGNLKIPQPKCCDSVVDFLRTGCDGEAEPERVARVRQPLSPTPSYCLFRTNPPSHAHPAKSVSLYQHLKAMKTIPPLADPGPQGPDALYLRRA
jgi:hypothetical protein